MSGLYKALLKIYPPEYRDMFASEMLDVFEEVFQERSRRGAPCLLPFLFAELLCLIKGALEEWIARFTYSIYHSGSYISKSCSPNYLLMRPAGIDREAYFLEPPSGRSASVQTDTDSCLNIHQRFVSASPLRRLFMLTCAMFFSMHGSK